MESLDQIHFRGFSSYFNGWRVSFCVSVWLQFHFNPAQSVLVVEGEDVGSINTAMTKVSYINSRQFPTSGLRRLHITTTVQYVYTHTHTQPINVVPLVKNVWAPFQTSFTQAGETPCLLLPAEHP